MKPGMGKQKGNQFERECCKLLSLWWSEGKRDDVFYRTQSSGGRATQRAKKGQTTSNHYGDIAATDEEGLPFTKFVTVEIKRGYNQHPPYDLIDKLPSAGPTKFEEWIDQATADCQKAKAKYWWLIIKRDRRRTMLFINNNWFADLVVIAFPQLDVQGYYLEKFLKEINPVNFRRPS